MAEVLCALNNMDAGGYGFISGGRGPYGRVGLEMQEAHLLWWFRAFIDGWLAGTSQAEGTALDAAMKAEAERVASLSQTSGAGL